MPAQGKATRQRRKVSPWVAVKNSRTSPARGGTLLGGASLFGPFRASVFIWPCYPGRRCALPWADLFGPFRPRGNKLGTYSGSRFFFMIRNASASSMRPSRHSVNSKQYLPTRPLAPGHQPRFRNCRTGCTFWESAGSMWASVRRSDLRDPSVCRTSPDSRRRQPDNGREPASRRSIRPL